MKIAELAIRNGTLTWALSLAVLILGWLAVEDLPRLADPQVSSREVRIVTPYPGASAAEVEREVSAKIEQAIRELGQLRRVESHSSRGQSIVSVVIHDQDDREALSRMRDELRRRIGDLQPQLPPGAGPSLVDDDRDDIYGFYYALTGEGFTRAELKRVAELLQRELTAIDGVRKAILFGEQQETVFVEVSKSRTRSLGIGLDDVFDALRHKNLPSDAGHIRVGPERVPIYPGGMYHSEQDFGELLIAGDKDRLIRLEDIAEIRRGYEDPPRRLLRLDGRPAIGVAVSIASGGNVVATGEAMDRILSELRAQMPLGMELEPISLQSATVNEAIDAFVLTLLQSAVMVLAALIVFMGLRGGLIVGFVALLTLAGTLVVMDYCQIALDRLSLGALIIALSLVTHNAILVVVDMTRRTDHGMTGIQAAHAVVSRNAMPLLAATAVTLLAFAAIGGIDGGIGEYVRGLYLVVPIALAISWVTAMTVAPLLANRFLASPPSEDEAKNHQNSRIRRLYARLLTGAIRQRWAVLSATTLLFAASIYGFGFVKLAFFPTSATPSFLVEVYFREGTHIRETERRMDEIQSYLNAQQGVTRVVNAIGDGHPRFQPGYGAGPDPGGHYGVGLVFVDDPRRLDAIRHQAQSELSARFPDAVVNLKPYVHASQTAGGAIQLRISGPDPGELRRLADRVKDIIGKDPDAKAVRDEWGAKVKVAYPVLTKDRARRLRVDRAQISDAMRTTYSGTVTGFYREDGALIPIIVRALEEERREVEDMADITVTSPLRGDKVPMLQLVDRLDTRTEDARRSRRDHRPTISVHADADQGLTSELLRRIKPRVEKALDVDLGVYLGGRSTRPDFELDADTIPIVPDDRIPLKGRPGYYIGWGGETEAAAESRAGLGASLPVYLSLMALVVIALFNALRQPLIVLLTVPPSLIGVTAGLLLTGQPFGFMSLLGVLGLSGILMRNSILLLDEFDLEVRTGKARLDAILHSSGSRLLPVALAAGTSILAMIPLMQDGLFASMAVTVTCGLGVATSLSLVLVPVLYATLFRIGNDESGRKIHQYPNGPTSG